MSLKRFAIALLMVCSVGVCILSVITPAQAAASAAVWEMPQEYFEQNHFTPDDDNWITLKILRAGDSAGSSSLSYAVASQTLSPGNEPGQYELLGPNPVVFSLNSTYALIRVRFHAANHDLFGTQRLTFRLSSTDMDVEPGQDERTLYVDYSAIPVLTFASPPGEAFAGVKEQSKPVVINITKNGDAYTDSYVDVYASGTAAYGIDYAVKDVSGRPVILPGTIHIPPGQSVYPLLISLPDARPGSGNLTVTFTLGNAINADIGSMTGVTLTIYEKGTVLPSPTGTLSPTSAPGPTVMPSPAASMPSSSSTPVPLPPQSPWPGIAICIMTFGIAAACLLVKRK